MTQLTDIVYCIEITTNDNKVIQFSKLDLVRESYFFKNIIINNNNLKKYKSKYDLSFWHIFRQYIKCKCIHDLDNFDPITIFFSQEKIYNFINDYKMTNFIKYMNNKNNNLNFIFSN